VNNTNTILYKESANTAELYINGVKFDNITEFSVSKKGAMPAEIVIKDDPISEAKFVLEGEMKMAYIPLSNLSDTSCKKSEAPPQSFSERLRFALCIRGMSQAELCEKANVDKSAMSQYVKGSFEPRRERLERIAAALDVSEPWLMGWDVPFAEYDVTPGTYDAKKLSDDKNRRSKVVDILYNQMESLSVAEYAVEDFTDSCNLSLAMGAIAKAISYLEK